LAQGISPGSTEGERDEVDAVAAVESRRICVTGWRGWIERLAAGEVMHRRTAEEWLD